MSLVAAALSTAALLAGCGDDGPSPVPHSGTGGSGASGGAGGGGAGGGGGSGGEIAWAPCPEDYLTECASVEMPVDWSSEGGHTIPVLAARTLAKSGAGTMQLWLLQGGPGGSGNVFKGFVEAYADILPDVDFYVLEHRGVGESTRLGCAAEEAPTSEGGTAITASEWPSCLESLKTTWGDELAGFTTSNDARDLQRFIELTREPEKKVFVYGASYGTTRAFRFLQIFPEGADGVILDSVVSPGVQFLSQFDGQYDPVGMDIAELCAADGVCGQKMGADPWAHVVALKEQVDAGHCPALGVDSSVFSSIMPIFVQLRILRPHLFPLVYRMERCTDEDVQVIGHYFDALNQAFGGSGGPMRDSSALQNHVALSEMWEQPAPTTAELEARCDALTTCPGLGPQLGPLYDVWPRYQPDEYANGWPQSTLPILALNGTLDPQTPLSTAQVAADHLTAPHQTFVAVPFSPHGVIFESPVKTAGAPPCGLQMMQGFLADPTAAIDTTCLDDLVPVEFTVDPAEADFFFGTQDIWENVPALQSGAAPAKPDWNAVVETARRMTRRIGPR